jgi:hypothetical protein
LIVSLYQEIERSDKTSVKLGTRGTQFLDATEINSTCRSFNMGGKRAAGAFVSGKRWKYGQSNKTKITAEIF